MRQGADVLEAHWDVPMVNELTPLDHALADPDAEISVNVHPSTGKEREEALETHRLSNLDTRPKQTLKGYNIPELWLKHCPVFTKEGHPNFIAVPLITKRFLCMGRDHQLIKKKVSWNDTVTDEYKENPNDLALYRVLKFQLCTRCGYMKMTREAKTRLDVGAEFD